MRNIGIGAALALSTAAGMAGCSGGEAKTSVVEGVPRLESYCAPQGLEPPIRQTVLVIDQAAVRKAESAALIRTTNTELFQLVTGLAAADGVERGTMAPRERLNIYLAPADGSAPKLAFSGCVPGFSKDELKKMAGGSSGLSQALGGFVGSSPTQKVSNDIGQFKTAVVGALVHITDEAPAPHAAAPLLERSLLRSLQSAPQLAAPENGIPRLFFFTDVAAFAPEGLASPEAARDRGFEDADKARLPLGRAEVHVIGPKPAADHTSRAYAQAFFLGSEGRLLSWGGATFSALPAPPVRLDAFSGEINYPPTRLPAQARLSTDRNGTLVNSWFTVRNVRSTSTPLTGSMTCSGDGECHVTTDQGGLGQAWSRKQGPDPDFSTPDLPLGGLRQLSGEVRNDTLTGKVFDPMINQIGSVPGTKSLDFKMTRSRLAIRLRRGN